MTANRSGIFITISSIALLMVLIIQVNWIFETARIKEELFNEKANMVLSRTMEALSADIETCKEIGACVDKENNNQSSPKLGMNEIHKIDSLFNYYLKFYNFQIDYTYEVVKPNSITPSYKLGLSNNIYNKNLQEASNDNGFQLKLIFPEKKQFIIREMGTMFITSVLLIMVVLIMFWRTILSLIKEKKISEHTNDFLNNMTHEFKTPLTNIALAGKMITKDSNSKQEDKIKHYSEIILEENEKLRLQVEQVLSMTALERGEIVLRKSEVDLHELIKDSLKCMSVQIENKQGHLELLLKADKFRVMGDKTHLTNTLCNLIDNAIKYSKGNPEIDIQTYNLDQKLMLVVSDKGVGIYKEYHKKVFDKFFRVPTGDLHDVKGFGLGLAYVKKILELHAGTIEVQSNKDKGTTFLITLQYV